MIDVMVDLETLDTGYDAVILSLGAVEFAPGSPNLGEFYRGVLVERQMAKWRRTSSQKTIEWWSKQNADAQWAVFHDPARVELDSALLAFTGWLGGREARIWGNGATFDNVILSSAYAAVGLARPWSHKGDMCYRTLKGLGIKLGPGEGAEFGGTEHNALDDARYQAHYAAAWLGQLGGLR